MPAKNQKTCSAVDVSLCFPSYDCHSKDEAGFPEFKNALSVDF